MRVFPTLLGICCLAAFASTATAQIPDDVMNAYKSYSSAIGEKDYQKALKHGKTAWKKAESALGDSKTTGDLAFNYGLLEKTRGDASKAIDALERGVELADIGRDKGAEVKLERSVELVASLEQAEKFRDAAKAVDKALKQAQSMGLSASIFAGELKVHEGTLCARNANRAATRLNSNRTAASTTMAENLNGNTRSAELLKRCAIASNEALNIFDKNQTLSRPHYIALAANTIGNAYERKDQWLDAALAYQKSREAVEPVYGRDNPFVQQIITRWVNSYNHLDWMNKKDEALESGLCQCWPFASDGEKIGATKRVDMDIPTRALSRDSSGFTVLEGDISDAGKVVNIRTVLSWPQGKYDSPALKAFEQYEFAAKTRQEPEGYRKNVTQVFSIFVYSEASNKPY